MRIFTNPIEIRLSELTHKERPWLDARKGLSDDDRCSRGISHAAMAEYYGAL